MTLILSKLRRNVSKRFIALIEVIGYVMCAIVGGAAVWSLFYQVDITANASGEIHPVAATVRTDKDCVVLEFLVSSGQVVSADEPICRVATQPGALRRAFARRQLETAVAALEQDRGADSAEALATAKAALAELPPVTDFEILTAPSTGIVKLLVDRDKYPTIPAGEALARIYRETALAMEGVLEADTDERKKVAAKVAAGQTARVFLPRTAEQAEGEGEDEQGLEVEGVVVSVNSADTGSTVSLRFENVSREVQQLFVEQIFGDGTDSPLGSVRAQIVVGHQSLFMNMFGQG